MPIAGFTTSVKVSGTPTTLTTAATTSLGGDVYQVTDATKRVLDPDTAVVVFDDGVEVDAADNESIDFLFGKVTLTGPPVGAVTISGAYLPMLPVAEGYEVSFTDARELLDATVFVPGASTAARRKMLGLKSLSGRIGTLDALLTDLDSGGGTVTLRDLLRDGPDVLVEITVAASEVLRGWCVLSGGSVDASVDGRVEAGVDFEGSVLETQNGGDVSYGYGP
jgi:hypothetical protein